MSVRHASRSVVDALAPCRPSSYICRQCRRNAQLPQALTQQRRHASEGPDGLPFAERLRRKLWKGKPPGPENVDDLYGGPGAIETMYKKRKQRATKTESGSDAATPERLANVSQEDIPSPEPVQNPAQTYVPPAPFSTNNTQEVASTREVDKEDVPYTQATTWDGLSIIGQRGHWKEMPIRQKDEYSRWLESPARPNWSYPELVSLMHQAIVECHTFEKLGNQTIGLNKPSANSPLSKDELENATFNISSSGKITGITGTQAIAAGWLTSPSGRSKPEDEPERKYSFAEQEAINSRTTPIVNPLEPRLLYTPSDTTFLDARLEMQQSSTFAILKRFALLTNYTIPDPLLNNLASKDPAKNTIGAMLRTIAENLKPKPANIAEQLMKDENLASRNNLLILGRRETPVDKEKELGRWKVIEEELRLRGLPVLGKLQVQR